jgi:hypothetical protein
MANTLVSWRPEVVYGPVLSAHRQALVMTLAATKAITPKRTGKLAGSVKALPTGTESATIGTTLFYGKFVAGGAEPHDITAKALTQTATGRRRRGKRALAGGSFGPFARVHSPGTKATHFVKRGASTYVENFKLAGRAAFLRGVL